MRPLGVPEVVLAPLPSRRMRVPSLGGTLSPCTATDDLPGAGHSPVCRHIAMPPPHWQSRKVHHDIHDIRDPTDRA